MASILRMPGISADSEEAVLLEWSVAQGTEIHPGDVLATVETEKANVDIESDQDAVLWRTLVEPGTTVAVGSPIAILVAVDEQVDDDSSLFRALGIFPTGGSQTDSVPEPDSDSLASNAPLQEPATSMLLVQANSVLGKQIVTDLEVYADFKVAPNLRKLIEEVPVAAAAVSISDFDPNAEDFTFEDEYEVEYTQLEEDPMFSGILIQLSKATEVEQIGKWREWALKPKQASLFTEEYPSYEQDLDVLGERHRKTLPVKTLA